ncbi:homoserine dehydrogenase [Alicyclobacillus pomorum]|uniref:homoserine dehydrogenase n=1 Tax=Alicyclobacillus pomorum TaxID=204470 RepID=UPI0003FDD4BF|nr:homoserine dehydrogenase [Alicyclobacillus pomorum]
MNIYIGLLGCGTVGSGVVELLHRRQGKIADLTGIRPVIKRILVRDVTKPRDVPLDPSWLTASAQDVLADPDVSVIVETIGGIEPAREYILAALRAGKHVVTANKDLMALHGPDIYAAAEEAGVHVMYEAAVGGAIPLIRPLKECLAGNDITDVKGIVNGTSNYILSKMTETGADFDDVLREAQALGYAEADPSSDVDGLDAARKLVILASLAFNTNVRLSDVIVRGIRSVSATDVEYARELGAVIKLIAQGMDRDGKLVLRVHPTLIPKEHPLAHVSDANNALYVRGDAAGDLMFYGRGAGSLPTASAVVGDIIEILRNVKSGVRCPVPHVCLSQKPVEQNQAPPQRHYVRLFAVDRPGVFAEIAGIFGEACVSMETVLQKPIESGRAEIVIVTHHVSSASLQQVLDALAASEHVQTICCVLPVEAS